MSGAGRRPRPVPPWDAPVTIALLLWGVIATIQMVAAGRDLPDALDGAFSDRGVGHYTQTGVGTAIGWAVVVETLLALVLAIAFAVPRIRERRLAFWIPLAAAAASSVLTVVLISAAILADPAYVASLQHASAGGP